MPARDEARSIAALIDSLLAQSRPAEEIVVCDAGSRDATPSIVRGYAERGVRLVESGPAYPGRARNLGAAASEQPWIAFIDAGCVADPGWLAALLSARDLAPHTDVVYGDYDPFIRGEWDAAQALAIVSPRDTVTGCRPPFIASSLVRRATFSAVGGFPEKLRAAEDLLFFETLARRGAGVAWAPAARIQWTLPAGPKAVFRRLRLYSAHHAAAGLTHSWHQRILAMHAVLLLLAGLGFVWPVGWGVLAAAAGARLLRTVLARRLSVPPEAGTVTPARVLRAGILLAVADAACVAGYVDFRRGRLELNPK